MTAIDEIYALMRSNPENDECALIQKAHDFAKAKHEGQFRASGAPYFTHAFAVGKNLAALGMDARTIAAGLIHDTLEDTETTRDEIEREFGKEILFLVEGVTKLGALKYRGRDRHVESLRKFFVAVAEDVRVLMIKLADRLHNISTLSHVHQDKQRRIALETIQIYAPLAGRLGMGKLKGELEDYAFPFAYPEEYAFTKKIIAEHTPEAQKQLEEIKEILELALNELGMTFTLQYRVKHTFSLYRKLKKYDMNVDKVLDIVALRVIVEDVEACYRVLGLVHSTWKPVPRRIKDYIALPKPNGYQSLHTTVVSTNGTIAEIQIRTRDMDDEAEYGIAAHFSYKEDIERQPGDKLPKKFAWLAQLADIQKSIAEPEEFLEHLAMDFFKDRIFILTPKGDVVDLPEDATPIDFAYAIHSDIGDHVFGAKMNGKMVSLDSRLRNGAIVEIITKESAKPVPKWIEYAKTSMARRHIRSYLLKHAPDNVFVKKQKPGKKRA
ncbi:MAG: RelA/SpoT family protein [Candidatus Pacebacteria bacterium]|jgi:GTP pyrophosphokinase|nr:RelA/SpoT family protein [Candidatus Paceibacterota bacterium]